mmetsp:Transcript_24705/g.62384  ORF Transcript_24705/g.62384 Transcript_24705/m.62384 type:complete len:213 (+) Transcript_24705:46-684(+)
MPLCTNSDASHSDGEDMPMMGVRGRPLCFSYSLICLAAAVPLTLRITWSINMTSTLKLALLRAWSAWDPSVLVMTLNEAMCVSALVSCLLAECSSSTTSTTGYCSIARPGSARGCSKTTMLPIFLTVASWRISSEGTEGMGLERKVARSDAIVLTLTGFMRKPFIPDTQTSCRISSWGLPVDAMTGVNLFPLCASHLRTSLHASVPVMTFMV